MVLFPLLRMIANEFESDPTLLYSILYMYLAVSTLGVIVYGIENLKLDEIIEQNRQPNGEVKCNPLVFLHSILFFVGPGVIPLIKVIRNRNDPCHNTFS